MSEQTIIPPTVVEPASPVEAYSYARFMDRLIAFIIDYVILDIAKVFIVIPLFTVTMIGGALALPSFTVITQGAGLSPSVWLVSFVLDWIYFAVMESSARGATIGKRAMKLRVLNDEGQRISFGKATLRYFSKIISWIPLMLGFIMAIFTKRKQALHDLIAQTIVVDVEK